MYNNMKVQILYVSINLFLYVNTDKHFLFGGCQNPKLTLNGTPAITRQGIISDYNTLTEIKFNVQVAFPPDRYKNRLCKLNCINGQWVGPLCQDEEDDKFHHILKNCTLNLNGSHLIMIDDNVTISNWSGLLSDRTKVKLRCEGAPGLYKFSGYSNLQCINGNWTHSIPECILTTLITSYEETSPPTIKIIVTNGYSATDFETNTVIIYPGSIVHLECFFKRHKGEPIWSWSNNRQHRLVGWALSSDERENIYRMSIFYIKPEDSSNYTCTTPKGINNTVQIKVEVVSCEKRNYFQEKYLIFKAEGNRLGQKITFSCPKGYLLKGNNTSHCLTNGMWSSDIPFCEPILCPPIKNYDKHLIIFGSNTTYLSHFTFECQQGYTLMGQNNIYCEINGNWSASIPTCLETLCPTPNVPINGKLIEETNFGTYTIGTIVQFTCNEPYKLIGEETIICQEKGIWSHSFPYCG